MLPFANWLTFAQVIGSAAAALTGLQFVAMALIADVPMRSGEEGVSAFVNPTIVHFVAALLLAASFAVPWPRIGAPAIFWSFAGAGGLGYGLLTSYSMGRQTAYQPVLEDWIFHGVLPLVAYAGLLTAGLLLRRHASGAPFGAAGVSVLLLTVGTHNSWDNLNFLVLMKRRYVRDGTVPGQESGSPQADRGQLDAGR